MPVEEIDYLDPVQAFTPWAGQAWSMLFDSARPDSVLGRYSYICVAPFQTITVTGGKLFVDGRAGEMDPFACLEALLAKHKTPRVPELPAFQGGAAGYIGYEMARYLERIDAPGTDDMLMPDMAMGLKRRSSRCGSCGKSGLRRAAWLAEQGRSGLGRQ